LPVGTPPNAIAYSTGKVSIKDMLRAGIILTVISIIVLSLVARFLWL
jgi:sodium-dependent dicarboxylate transporter 2/3/5